MNKELPKEQQLRVVLQNYDKKQAECDALKKENADLKKQIEQKDALYKNMLEHFKDKDTDEGGWKHQYKILKSQYTQRGEKVTNQANKLNQLRRELQITKNILDSVRGAICGAYNKIEDFCTESGIGNKAIISKDNWGALEYSSLSEVSTQEKKFISYIREVIENYKKTGSLRGIATIGREYGVSSLSKEQFFRFGLHEEKDFTDEYLLSLYEKAKKHL